MPRELLSRLSPVDRRRLLALDAELCPLIAAVWAGVLRGGSNHMLDSLWNA